MLIKCKNGDLYRQWIAYYERTSTMKPYEIRTYAFFNSEEGRKVPLT
jgi:hypothetical protein